MPVRIGIVTHNLTEQFHDGFAGGDGTRYVPAQAGFERHAEGVIDRGAKILRIRISVAKRTTLLKVRQILREREQHFLNEIVTIGGREIRILRHPRLQQAGVDGAVFNSNELALIPSTLRPPWNQFQ